MIQTGELFLLLLLTTFSVSAHVVLVDPTPRSNNDYLYSSDESICRGTSCDAFCGDPLDAATNPWTELPVETRIQIRWRTTVIHEPYEYRISLSRGGDEGFDVQILAIVKNLDANDDFTVSTVPRTGSFTANVTIPKSYLAYCASDTSSPPCTMQLYDLYYFVSCANVVVSSPSVSSPNDGEQRDDVPLDLPMTPLASYAGFRPNSDMATKLLVLGSLVLAMTVIY